MRLELSATALWGLFVLSWYVGALWTAPAVKRTSLTSRAVDYVVYVIAFSLLLAPQPGMPQLWRTPLLVGAVLLGIEAAAFAFAWWARVTLGRLWSGMITLREGHRVIQNGPYGLVRHPIYTGFLGAAWALALIAATPASLAGALILTAAMTLKAKREEAFLRRELGEAEYDDYARRTPMLLPWPR